MKKLVSLLLVLMLASLSFACAEDLKYKEFVSENGGLTDDSGAAVTSYSLERLFLKSQNQGGDILDGLYYTSTEGMLTVIDMETNKSVGAMLLAKSEELTNGSKVTQPHCNSLSAHPAEGFDYPLIYTNCYSDKQNCLATLCVYSLGTELNKRGKEVFVSKLEQVIRIGFSDSTPWLSTSGGDKFPYGNFVVDSDNGLLYAIDTKSGDDCTTFFVFPLPELTAGEYDEKLECNVLSLMPEDALYTFDTPYINTVQDAEYHDGKLYIVAGMANSPVEQPACMHVIDAVNKCRVAFFDLIGDGYVAEPEMISWYDGSFYFSQYGGTTYKMYLK